MKQKTREIWLEGDRNAKSFHKMANVHRKIIFLTKIKLNGEWLSKENEINEEVAQAFPVL